MTRVSRAELTTLSMSEAADLIAAGKLRSLELVDALLDRIRARESVVQAWSFLDPDYLRMQARERDAMSPRGPLHGVPIGIKDVIDTVDQPTTYNSSIYAGYRPVRDAHCVRLLREAGAIIMGKTVTAEFAFQHPGATRNPHDPDRTPGGSSSGSAAATADGMVPAALATQTGGSTIRPSSYCGIFGYKPAHGRYSTAGLKPLAPSFDTLGFMARDLLDIARMLSVMSASPATAVGRGDLSPAFVLFYTPYSDQAEPAAVACLQDFAARARMAGAVVRSVDAPEWLAGLDAAHRFIMAQEASISLADEWHNHRSQLSPVLAELIANGRQATDDQIQQAHAFFRRAKKWFTDTISPTESILTFATAGEAPLTQSKTGSAVFNRLWSALGYPCLSLPVGRGPNNMPVAVQLVDPTETSDRLIQVGQWLARRLAVGFISPSPSS